MRNIVVDAVVGILPEALSRSDIEKQIEVPPNDEMGDYALPCFFLAKALRKGPAAIAGDLASKLAGVPGIERVEAVSGYLNFYLDKGAMAERILSESSRDDYGQQGREGTFVVEFASPNTNKPLHLGHLRNISIGESVARILQFCGCRVVRACINNDRGVHICKSMLAYKELSGGATPESTGIKSDHFVGHYYVEFNKKAAQDPAWNERAQEMLRRWEAGDQETVALWKEMNRWALEGFEATYRLFGIKFDREYYESQIYKSGKEIVTEGLERGIFTKRDDGAVIVNLEQEGLGEKVLLRADGTSVYIVQDLYLAVLKEQEYHYDSSIYVVGNEQDYHFAVLVAIFRKLGYALADKIRHLSYGMVELPEGKMKSREGTVVDADDLIRETQELARAELRERYTLSDEEMEERSLRIALSAIKYQLLKVDISKNMVFDPKKAISFEGDTGPYLLYSYARASSILRKASRQPARVAAQPGPEEIRLFKTLAAFPSTVAQACERLLPSSVATYAFELAQKFNEFYHACQVIGSEQEEFRLGLVSSFRSVLGKCLDLMGIREIEEM